MVSGGGNFFIGGIVAARAGIVVFPADLYAGCSFAGMENQVVTFGIDRLDLFRTTYITGKYSFAGFRTGSRSSYPAAVPFMRRLIIRCITARALIPVFVAIMLPHREIVPQSRDITAADRAH